jgi:predicted O-linked N-acetylglucosamine transferase (SPINDLY family)
MKNDRHRAEQHRQAGLKALQASQWAAAVAEFTRATRLAPQDALMRLNLARAHARAGQSSPAIEAAREAFRLDPASPLACRVLAEYLGQENRFDEAAAVFDALPPEAPRDFDFHNAHGNALFQCKRLQDAVGVFFQALSLKIDAAIVHYRLGLTFKDLAMTREATECFRTAVSLDEGQIRALALSLLVFEGRQTCDWSLVDQDTAQLLAALDNTDDASGQLLSPFALLAVEATPAQQRRIGALRVKGLAGGIKPLPAPGPRKPGPIRIGYLSCDFHQHATSVLMAELLERRDSARFEVFLYSHSPDDGSAIGRRVRAACEHFVDVTHWSNADIARRMRADDIDIAIDLKGHTRGSRFELLAWRPARVQAAYLGYPATTGADFIDYMIGDPVVTPLAHAANFSERIAQLPHSYQPNDRRRALPPAPTRAALGLPEDAVVLCCFNQVYKFSPHMLDLWAQILREAPKAVLWMLAWNPHAQANLTRELQARGIGAERVFWAPKQNLTQHIARLRAADLFLDTWPCNAHTTASEALWAGVPVITVPGPTFASRVAASLVSACGLPDLAVPDEASYVAMSAALANEPATLGGLKQHLESQRMSLPLFDSDAYVRDYEALLVRMFERAEKGLSPDHLPA